MARVAGRDRLDALVPARARGAVPAARRRAARDGVLVGQLGSVRGKPTGSSSARPTACGPRPRCWRSAPRSRSRRCARAAAVAWPFAAHARTYVVVGLRCRARGACARDLRVERRVAGEAAPLPYVPLLNPLELASVLVLLALLDWLGAVGRHGPELDAARLRPAVRRPRRVVPRHDDGCARGAPLGGRAVRRRKPRCSRRRSRARCRSYGAWPALPR